MQKYKVTERCKTPAVLPLRALDVAGEGEVFARAV